MGFESWGVVVGIAAMVAEVFIIGRILTAEIKKTTEKELDNIDQAVQVLVQDDEIAKRHAEIFETMIQNGSKAHFAHSQPAKKVPTVSRMFRES